ncbi:hypothetical protein VTG60DRAFT_6550 [Thermothelomyces hinnuleus]
MSALRVSGSRGTLEQQSAALLSTAPPAPSQPCVAGSAAHNCSIAVREPVQVIAAVSVQDAAIAPAPGIAGSAPASYNVATIPG